MLVLVSLLHVFSTLKGIKCDITLAVSSVRTMRLFVRQLFSLYNQCHWSDPEFIKSTDAATVFDDAGGATCVSAVTVLSFNSPSEIPAS